MSAQSPTDYKALFEREKRERERVAADLQRVAADLLCERERNQKTTYSELLLHCHRLLTVPLRADTPSKSTAGSIPLPVGKYCPRRLRPWQNYPAIHKETYDYVHNCFHPVDEPTPRFFSSVLELEGLSRRVVGQLISSEKGLEKYERSAVDDHVGDIISQLCQIPAAKEKFGLGDGIRFDDHTNSLERSELGAGEQTTVHRPKADDFCIKVVDKGTDALITSGEYKPPHKLPTATIRLGLGPIDVWNHLVASQTIPTDHEKRLKYNAERLVCSVVVQQYHVMIQDGLTASYITNGFCDIYLWVPHDDPATLYYYVCEPTRDVRDDDDLRQAKTAISRRLCLYLLCSQSDRRGQEWRNNARSQLPVWKTSFDYTRSQIADAELSETYLYSEEANDNYESPEASSEFQPSSSPTLESPTPGRRHIQTRSQPCRPPSEPSNRRSESPDSPQPEGGTLAQRKRGYSQIAASPSENVQSDAQTRSSRGNQGTKQRATNFCTLRCLYGLRNKGVLDENCPNVNQHRQVGEDTHQIDAKSLVKMLKDQLDENMDQNCTPWGQCGQSGAPFKLTCATYGYTVIGKGTTNGWWDEVSREADAYRVLRNAEASAVTVFLGKLNMSKVYFLEGAGEIRHMLVMGWGGRSPESVFDDRFLQEFHRSAKEIYDLGVQHQDLRAGNVLWNEELQRVLIIDFHRCRLVPKLSKKRARRLMDRSVSEMKHKHAKRLRVV
ncbi:Hypothetical protein R9X50_00168900 [Acrodontium crateriforme]|uniref:Uncharacterized protein n=1 Tax=Acrodontium crateriforme TaxID=150365 RepID=A0AAQ3R8E6_9PEZI|nr:Hypothetical protein R9X50_00168900 [Acrodontium crateriforme]